MCFWRNITRFEAIPTSRCSWLPTQIWRFGGFLSMGVPQELDGLLHRRSVSGWRLGVPLFCGQTPIWRLLHSIFSFVSFVSIGCPFPAVPGSSSNNLKTVPGAKELPARSYRSWRTEMTMAKASPLATATGANLKHHKGEVMFKGVSWIAMNITLGGSSWLGPGYLIEENPLNCRATIWGPVCLLVKHK